MYLCPRVCVCVCVCLLMYDVLLNKGLVGGWCGAFCMFDSVDMIHLQHLKDFRRALCHTHTHTHTHTCAHRARARAHRARARARRDWQRLDVFFMSKKPWTQKKNQWCRVYKHQTSFSFLTSTPAQPPHRAMPPLFHSHGSTASHLMLTCCARFLFAFFVVFPHLTSWPPSSLLSWCNSR